MAEHGFHVWEDTSARQCFRRNGHDIVVETEAIDLQHFVERIQGRGAWDLLIAHAVLDLLDIPATLPSLLGLLRPGGLLYGSMIFDGATILQPEIDPEVDAQIEALYHQTMDQRRIADHLSGDSRSGRHVFAHLRAVGADILAAGSSDWIIFAGPQGYPGDDSLFLAFHCPDHRRRLARPFTTRPRPLDPLDRPAPGPDRDRSAGVHRPSTGRLGMRARAEREMSQGLTFSPG